MTDVGTGGERRHAGGGAAREAAARAAEAVLDRQDARGAWRGRNDAGPMFLAVTVVLLAALDALDDATRAAAERTLRRAPLADGGLPPWPGATSSNAEATLYLWAALAVLGVPAHEPVVQAARRRVEALGGASAAGPLGLTIGALAGVVPARDLPRVPPALALLPGHDRAIARVLGVNALLPAHVLPFLWAALRGGWRSVRATDATARRLSGYLSARQNRSGGIAGVPIFTLLALVCLRLSGVTPEDERMRRGLAYVRRVVHPSARGELAVEPFTSEYWDTAHMVRALAAQGSEASLASAARGGAWLIAGQAREPSPEDWQTAPAGAPLVGGWSWQVGNERNPDLDTTAEVLSALGALAATSPAAERATRAAIDRGRAWLLGLQNPDGGFAAFSWGKPRPPRGALYLRAGRGPLHRARAWLAENGDPSTVDIVGRVLEGLAATAPPEAWLPARARAVGFLREQQEPSGAFWGRWAINYVAGTAYVLSGLARAEVDLEQPWLRAATDWLLERQNGDGGFGESPRSYADPREAGRGPSTVALTGLVHVALGRVALRTRDARLAARLAGARARATELLLARQGRDGWFSETACFSTMFPLRAYWINDTYPTFFALEALAHDRR